MKKVLVVLGTRPEVIKLAPVVRCLRRSRVLRPVVCVTAQHRHMLDQMMEVFDLKTDFDLNVMTDQQSLVEVSQRVLEGVSRILHQVRPTFVLVQGDTTTTFASTLAASYAKVPFAHVEAGLRTYDKHPFPEEINRRLTAQLADIHFAPTLNARNNLLREGISEDQVLVTGNTVVDALHWILRDVNGVPKGINGLSGIDWKYDLTVLVTAHRRENWNRMERICSALRDLVRIDPRVHVIFPVHPNLFYAAAIPLAWIGHTVAGLALAIVLRSWGPTLLTFILNPLRPAFWFSRKDIGPIADFGFSVAASSMVNMAVYSVPAVFVGKLSGMQELGQAQMAFSLYSNLLFVTAAVVRLNLSAYARLIGHATEFAAIVNQHLQILCAVMVPLIVIFAGFAPIWTSLVFSDKWHELPVLLLVQVPGYLLAAVCWGVLNPALLVSGKHRQVLLWLTGFFILYSGLTRLLSPTWGPMGVAMAFSSTEIILHPWLFSIYGIKHLKYGCFFPGMLLGAAFAGILWVCARLDLRVGFLCASFYLIVWCAHNRKILTSAMRNIDLLSWYRPTQNVVSIND